MTKHRGHFWSIVVRLCHCVFFWGGGVRSWGLPSCGRNTRQQARVPEGARRGRGWELTRPFFWLENTTFLEFSDIESKSWYSSPKFKGLAYAVWDGCFCCFWPLLLRQARNMLFGGLGDTVIPPSPEVVEWPYTVGGGGDTPPSTHPSLQTKVTIMGNNGLCHWDNLVRAFLVHKLLGPSPPPPQNKSGPSFLPGLRPMKNFLWRFRVPVVQTKIFFSTFSASDNSLSLGRGGGVRYEK